MREREGRRLTTIFLSSFSAPVTIIAAQPPTADTRRTVRSLEALESQQQPGAQVSLPSKWENDLLVEVLVHWRATGRGGR